MGYPTTGRMISGTELLILAVPAAIFLSLLIRPGPVRGKIVRTFAGRRESVLFIRRAFGLPNHPKVRKRWNTAGYIVSIRTEDGDERDVFCIVHFHPFLPYAQRVEILEE
jgi:hypothetical protein